MVANNQPWGATKDLQQAKEKVLQEPQHCHVAMVDGKHAGFIPRECFQPATQGAGFTCKQNLPCAQRNTDTSSHQLWDQGKGTAGREALQAADAISSAHHPCMAVHVWEAATLGTHPSQS